MRNESRVLSLNKKNTLKGLAFIAPNFIGFLCFTLFPVTFSFFLAFSKWEGVGPLEFVAFDNFKKIFAHKDFIQSLGNTIVYSTFVVVLSMIAALVLALIVNMKLKGRNFFRSAIFFPYVASVVAVGVVWNSMFQPSFGPINELLRAIGVENPPRWLTSTDWAMCGVIIVAIWKNMGYFMIVYLAGLQGINPTLYEASTIDGANKFQILMKITFPSLAPTTFFVLMMLTINSFKTFDLIFALTEGGPGGATSLLSQYIYEQTFVWWNYGTASAASVVLFLIILTVTIIQFRIEKKFDY